ncbi:MAG: helix-turn-helix domain-containing protein [Chloroflexota bacterium]
MGTAERLAQLIDSSGLKQTAIAKRLGVSIHWVSNRARGVTPIRADEIPLLAAALGVRPADFFEEAAPPRPPRVPPGGAAPSYADIFTREVARMWHGEEMTDAEREFLASTFEAIHRSVHRYGERITEGRVGGAGPEEVARTVSE